MIVAWQFTARDAARKWDPSRRERYEWLPLAILHTDIHSITQAHPPNLEPAVLVITPYPTGRVFAGRYSRQ